jgi:hypothetical protein
VFLQAVLLAGCLAVGVGFGPFAEADRPIPVVIGMLVVAAMATQNALVRFALPGSPSTAVPVFEEAGVEVEEQTLDHNAGTLIRRFARESSREVERHAADDDVRFEPPIRLARVPVGDVLEPVAQV